jgi:hypothetical protein
MKNSFGKTNFMPPMGKVQHAIMNRQVFFLLRGLGEKDFYFIFSLVLND